MTGRPNNGILMLSVSVPSPSLSLSLYIYMCVCVCVIHYQWHNIILLVSISDSL